MCEGSCQRLAEGNEGDIGIRRMLTRGGIRRNVKQSLDESEL